MTFTRASHVCCSAVVFSRHVTSHVKGTCPRQCVGGLPVDTTWVQQSCGHLAPEGECPTARGSRTASAGSGDTRHNVGAARKILAGMCVPCAHPVPGRRAEMTLSRVWGGVKAIT